MREHGLLSPHWLAVIAPEYPHEGALSPRSGPIRSGERTQQTVKDQDGHVTVFAARFEALGPIRQGVREHFGGFSGASPTALCLRHDHGSV
jgi:putative transposase